jgi:hypothetical protein
VFTLIQSLPPFATMSTLTEVTDCFTRERLLGFPLFILNIFPIATNGRGADVTTFQTEIK